MRRKFTILGIVVAALIVITALLFLIDKYREPDLASALIKEAFKGNSIKVRADSTYRLGFFKERKVVDALITLLDDEMLDSWAADSLGRIGDPRAVKPLLEHVYINQKVNRFAVIALGKIGNPEVLDKLIEINSVFIPKNESEQNDKNAFKETIQKLRYIADN